jgi:4-hydroxy-2-oxoheptanedioate aldolase
MTDLPKAIQKGKAFQAKLAAGHKASGAWSTLGSADVAFLMARAGLDYVLVDLEHGRGGIDGLAAQVLALTSLDAAVMVRLPDHSVGSIKRILDAGANILLVPQVKTVAEVEAVLDAALFAPDGQRGVAVGAIAAADYGYEPESYFSSANDALTILVQIETREAVSSLSDILAEKRVDGVFIGPNDLSAAMGLFRQYEHADFVKTFEYIREQTLTAGKIFGALPTPNFGPAVLFEKGAQVVPAISDQALLRNGAIAAVAAAQEANE